PAEVPTRRRDARLPPRFMLLSRHLHSGRRALPASLRAALIGRRPSRSRRGAPSPLEAWKPWKKSGVQEKIRGRGGAARPRLDPRASGRPPLDGGGSLIQSTRAMSYRLTMPGAGCDDAPGTRRAPPLAGHEHLAGVEPPMTL